MKTKIKATNEYNLQIGTKFIFTITQKVFIISKVTDKRVSWTTEAHTSGCSVNIMRSAWSTLSSFNRGIANGNYIVK